MRWCRSEDSETVLNGIKSENAVFPSWWALVGGTVPCRQQHDASEEMASQAQWITRFGVWSRSPDNSSGLRAISMRACSPSVIEPAVESPQCHTGLACIPGMVWQRRHTTGLSILCSDYLPWSRASRFSSKLSEPLLSLEMTIKEHLIL